MIGRVTEGERRQGGIEMNEASFVVVRPWYSVVVLDGEGVDPVE